MPRNLINSSSVKSLRPKDGCKLTKYCDGDGLYIWVYDDGKKKYKRYFFRYRYNKMDKPEILLGSFPAMSLAEARIEADKMRALLKDGYDPAIERKKQKAAGNFESLAMTWFSTKMTAKSESYQKKVLASLKNDVFPFIGKNLITDISAPDILDVLRRVEKRGAVETAHRIRSRISMIFDFGVASGLCENNPAARLSSALTPVVGGHMAAPTTPEEVSAILKILDGYHGSFIVRCALKLGPMLFVRPGELRQAKWKEIDLDKAEWRYLVTKTNTEHIVPLATQAVEILRELYKLTGGGEYVFPSLTSQNRPMSNNAVLAAYRRMGLTTDEVTGHGWRATARTMLDEIFEYPPYIIEQQLAHKVLDPLGRAYNRTKHLEQRKEMMQRWADYLEELSK